MFAYKTFAEIYVKRHKYLLFDVDFRNRLL